MGMPISINYDSSSPFFQPGAQLPINVDWTQNPFSLRVAVVIPAGSSATYGIEWTADSLDASPIRWLPDATLPAGQTSSGTTSFSSPIQFVRVNIASLSGSLELKVIQGLPQ